jgi:hypothetical protein
MFKQKRAILGFEISTVIIRWSNNEDESTMKKRVSNIVKIPDT